MENELLVTGHIFHFMDLFKDKIRQEILDGRKSWSVEERTAKAYDLFEVQVVRPLRELFAEGFFEDLREIPKPLLGEPRVGQVKIFGLVNLGDE
jgi:hypothetical protein